MELNYKILCQIEISFDNIIPSLSFYQILSLIYLLNIKIKDCQIFEEIDFVSDFILHETHVMS